MNHVALRVSYQDYVCRAQIHRPGANNTINGELVAELGHVLGVCGDDTRKPAIKVLVLEGLPDVFCSGGDFAELRGPSSGGEDVGLAPEPLYDLWLGLTTGPFVSISVVRGKVNAGGVGFVAASDVVIADNTAQFSLSELLFGVLPACVLPFLVRRVGFQKANFLALMTRPFSAEEARDCGLVDVLGEDAEALLRKHLLRLRCLSRGGISRYKHFMSRLDTSVFDRKQTALAANREAFRDPENLAGISRYLAEGKFPWEE
jgi:polyketide biosynthesis enoyl-CoA hydratase PksH